VFTSLSYPPIPIWELGPLRLSLHGLFAGLGFVAGAYLMVREARKRRFDADAVQSVLTWALVAAILGARFFTIPAHIGEAGYGFSDAISLGGDYSILGGYAGGVIGALIRLRILKLHIPVHLDMAAAGMALGAVVGRIGDLLIVEHLGSATSFFLGYELKPGYEVAPQHQRLIDLCDAGQTCGPYHHTALYDMLAAAVLLAALIWLARVWQRRHYGQLFAVWAVWYGLQRFFIDFARLEAAEEGSRQVIADAVMGPFTGSQWGALIVAALGMALFAWMRWKMPIVNQRTDIDLGAAPVVRTRNRNGGE
jgi:phosphatidylglycerol:prolipoprotein diacylglycerol transferase